MTSDHEIGRIVAVDTAQVTIELNRDLKALTRSTYEGTVEVGSINSYVIIPVGSRRIVAMVTRVVLTEESEIMADKMLVSLPWSRRLVKATMIGTLDEGEFRQGIALFPVLDSPVLVSTKDDLNIIFGKRPDIETSAESHEAEDAYRISVGRSTVFPDYEIKIDPDAFFGKHAAIIGSTGSGKSCSIATIIQSIVNHAQVKQTRFVILDTNGEYKQAFHDDLNLRCLYIPTDSAETEHLVIPYWFMNSDDLARLFRASAGVQKPVLLDALSAARNGRIDGSSWFDLRSELIAECNSILALCEDHDSRNARQIRQLCDGISGYLSSDEVQVAIEKLADIYGSALSKEKISSIFAEISSIVRRGIRSENSQYENYAAVDLEKRSEIKDQVNPLLNALTQKAVDFGSLGLASADSPSYFSKFRFRHHYLERALSRDGAATGRLRENSSTMLMRIYRLLEDSRFEFLFGPVTSQWPRPAHSLASFIRDILGIESAPDAEESLSDEQVLQAGDLPFYDRQRKRATKSNVVVVDLSLLASEVLENVTALLGRLIHEFLQRLSDPDSGVGRGEFPVVLVLEEAQNYIRENARIQEDSISKEVFERIAREGRKYGLGLVIASQRPSELSRTVLSQCNSFVVHRLQNPEDLRYFREIVPNIYGQLLDQLPALAPRNALILGACIQAPALVYMREADPAPRSKDPSFFKSWSEETPTPDIELVCRRWETESQAQEEVASS